MIVGVVPAHLRRAVIAAVPRRLISAAVPGPGSARKHEKDMMATWLINIWPPENLAWCPTRSAG